jgi:3',5'-nucleoside bisphosphate phosphatase
MPDRANLHLHSTCSDGILSPSDIVALCAEHGLGVIALTDHDTDEGIGEARAAGMSHGIEVLSGIEISAIMPQREVHILGYGFEAGHPAITRYRARLRAERERRSAAMVEALQALGLDIDISDVHVEAGAGMVGRPHVARALVSRGHVENELDAFDQYIADGRPAYVAKRGLSARASIDLIHETGGVAVLAHPGQWTTDEEIRQLVDAGLDGIEVIHPSHQTYLAEYWMSIALRYGLIRTGGSDYHGSRPDEADPDAYTIPADWVERLRDRIESYSID